MSQTYQVNSEPIPGYRMTKYLGRGGVGEVWQVEAPGKVAKAVKLIPLENTEALLSDRELQGLAKIRSIRHPYLLSIDRYEITKGYVIIVMELADKSLADRFEECARAQGTGIPRDELLRYMHESAEVLDLLAVEHQLQHLDIKPENLFLMSGHIKVADFGLVHSSMAELSASALAFTPAYAPPELFNGRIAPSADQYSLAVTYQELLTGRRPFDATSFRELVFAHDNLQPDFSSAPPQDRAILLRATSKKEADRFPSCTAFIEALLKAGKLEEVAFAPKQRPPSVQFFVPAAAPDAKNGVKIQPAKAEGKSVKPMYTRTPTQTSSVGREPAWKSSPLDGKPASKSHDRPLSIELQPHQDKVVNTFVTCVTPELYALKLRAFIDGMGAEIEGLPSPTDTMLRFRPNRNAWFTRRSSESLFLRIESSSRPAANGAGLIQATVYSSDSSVVGPALTRKSILLVRALRGFLMASDNRAETTFDAESIKAELWAT
jgi:serine/threonine protein kinase